MNEIIEQRLKVLDTFKSNYGAAKDGTKKQLIYLKIGISLYFTVLIMGFGFFVTAFALDENNIWDHSALLVVVSLNAFLFLRSDLLELKLTKHENKLSQNKDIQFEKNLNVDIDKIITRLNHRFKNKWHIYFLTIIILISGTWQTFPDANNPYWEFTKYPYILFIGILVIDYFITARRISVNIKKVENQFQP